MPVGAWHRKVNDILNDQLADLCPVMFTGSEAAPSKREVWQAFMDSETSIMLMPLRAGAGLGGLQERAAGALHPSVRR